MEGDGRSPVLCQFRRLGKSVVNTSKLAAVNFHELAWFSVPEERKSIVLLRFSHSLLGPNFYVGVPQ